MPRARSAAKDSFYCLCRHLIVLMSPDIDADVSVAKIFGIFSDPDLPNGKVPNPRLVFPHSDLPRR
jgi:hypothetical protein